MHPFPGAAELLRRTHDAGIVVVLATSAPADELGQMLRGRLGAEEAIDAWTNTGRRRTGLETGPGNPGHDARAPPISTPTGWWPWATASGMSGPPPAGMACLTVETGGFSQHELDEAGAVHVYRDVGALLAQFDTSPARHSRQVDSGERWVGGRGHRRIPMTEPMSACCSERTERDDGSADG